MHFKDICLEINFFNKVVLLHFILNEYRGFRRSLNNILFDDKIHSSVFNYKLYLIFIYTLKI